MAFGFKNILAISTSTSFRRANLSTLIALTISLHAFGLQTLAKGPL
jgi:hypothetical protein